MPALSVDGYEVIENAIGQATTQRLVEELTVGDTLGRLVREGQTYAIRNLLAFPAIAALAGSPTIRRLVEPHLGPNCFAVRGILFDKIADANWKVTWHQDLTIEVQERLDVDGFGPWSVKAGIQHVQPSIAILEQMLAVRIHLHDCGPENGPLQVIPGSHRHGRLSIDQMLALREEHGEVSVIVRRCGILLMRPLLAHASCAANSPRHRRVVHLEYAACELPGKLRWHSCVQD